MNENVALTPLETIYGRRYLLWDDLVEGEQMILQPFPKLVVLDVFDVQLNDGFTVLTAYRALAGQVKNLFIVRFDASLQ